jgi:hypothetical protein
MSERPIEDYSLPILWKRITELEDAIREHRDSFGHSNKGQDWTTEDETLWAMVQEKP